MFAAPLAALALAATALPAWSIVTPTSPDSTTVVKVGDQITAMWDVDPTGTWTDMEIQLMTGPNSPMVTLSTVGSGIDGTTTTSYSFVAPDVSPYSKIYFLQFTNGGDMTNVTWVTRFTIAGPNGETTDPTDSSVDSTGAIIEWGTGELVDASNSTSTASVTASDSAAATSASASSTTHSGLTAYNTDLPSTSATTSSTSGTVAAAAVSAPASSKSGAGKAVVGVSVGGGLAVGFVGAMLACLM